MKKFERVAGVTIIMAVLLSVVLFVPQLAIADNGGREPGGYALHEARGTEATGEPFQQIEPEDDTGSLVPVGPLQTGWQTIMTDGFEGAWPGVWTITNNPVDAYWDATDAISHIGSQSAFCAGGGSQGVAFGENYPPNMYTMIVYGPFSLADAVDAKVDYYLWLDSEVGYDYFKYQVSVDGQYFYGGGSKWGNTGGWVAHSFDLSSVCGAPNVWIAFAFTSDGSNPRTYYGALIDDVVLQKYVGTDLKAVEVYCSTEPGDMAKEHVVNEPTVGQDLYFHFRFSSIAPGTTPTFHNEFKLDGTVFDSAEGTAEGGHTYVWWSDIPWAATAGAHTLTGVLDAYDDVAESDETNNDAEKSWNTAAQFDLEAVEVYLSTQVGDMAKEYVVSEPTVGQEIYFHFKWNCIGSGTTPSFRSELRLDGTIFDSGNITVEDGMDYTLWTDIPWTATAGAHTLTGVLDVNNDVAESNEANNEASRSWGDAAVDISVVLQGGSRPPEAWEVPTTIKFFSPGADVMLDTPISEFNLTTTKSDGTATCQCAGVTPGTYDVTVQASNCPECTEGNCTLTNVKRSVVISTPSTAVDMGILLAGDANCDGIINISDFGILAVSYMCAVGAPCYDCRADFDCNGIINISDFGLLAVNYMKMSPIDVSG